MLKRGQHEHSDWSAATQPHIEHAVNGDWWLITGQGKVLFALFGIQLASVALIDRRERNVIPPT